MQICSAGVGAECSGCGGGGGGGGGGVCRPAGVIWVVGREIGNFVPWGAV